MNNGNRNPYLKKITAWETELNEIELGLGRPKPLEILGFIFGTEASPESSETLTKLAKITSGCLKILDDFEYRAAESEAEYGELQTRLFELRIKANLLVEKINAKDSRKNT
jgi:hypothetical protein